MYQLSNAKDAWAVYHRKNVSYLSLISDPKNALKFDLISVFSFFKIIATIQVSSAYLQLNAKSTKCKICSA